ncbi:probable MFS transporter [Vibrio sp. JCM 19236]|nr:probable MFS transporter [Vibrio sp. JCM 19236]
MAQDTYQLYGLVFFSHQIGSFLGAWAGGRIYDYYGSYELSGGQR